MRQRIRLRDEQGVALAMAMMIMGVLTVTAVGIIGYSTSNASSSDRTRVGEATLFAAESGIEQALSRLGQAADPRVTNLLPSTTTTVGAGSVTYSGTYDAGTSRWTVTSTATAPSPAGGTSALSRTVIQDLQVTGGLATVANNPAWGYIYADNPAGCTSFNSSVEIRQPIYVKNNLCLNNSVKIMNTANEIQVGGPDGITMTSSAQIGVADSGSPSAALPTLRVANRGCRYSTNAFTWPCRPENPNTGQRVLATSQINSVTAISKPPADFAARYASASPGPLDFCDNASPGLPANFFETNAIVNDRSAGNKDIMPNFNYTCTTATGQLSWNQTSSPGTLTINGTIFIDGNIWMNSSARAVVSGRGTIYVSGWVKLDGSMKICGKLGGGGQCDWVGWNPETSMLILAAGGSGPADTYPGNLVSIDFDSSISFQGGLWAQNMARVGSSVQMQGPIIGDKIEYNSSSNSRMVPFTNLPGGAPGSSGFQVAPAPGTWRES